MSEGILSETPTKLFSDRVIKENTKTPSASQQERIVRRALPWQISNDKPGPVSTSHYITSHQIVNAPPGRPLPSDLDMSTASSLPSAPTTPLTPAPQWPQQILGHHNLNDHSPNTTIPITPTEHKDILQYWEDLSQDHDNLHVQFLISIPDSYQTYLYHCYFFLFSLMHIYYSPS